MSEIVLRFLIGGVVVSAFASAGDLLRPKSFAGLFGAAPSVALATLGLTVLKDGKRFAALEGRSMVGGALAFLAYAAVVSWAMQRGRLPAIGATLLLMPVWFGVAFLAWMVWLR